MATYKKDIIQALQIVDDVIIYSDLNQIDKLKELNINIFTIGPEYFGSAGHRRL